MEQVSFLASLHLIQAEEVLEPEDRKKNLPLISRQLVWEEYCVFRNTRSVVASCQPAYFGGIRWAMS